MYTIKKVGYGHWIVSNGEEIFHTDNSRMIDALDDNEDSLHEEAIEWARRECKKVYQSDEEFYNPTI